MPASPQRRSSKFTPAIRRAIIEARQAGLPLRHACARAGVEHTTVYRWLEKAKTAPEDSDWKQFQMDLLTAEAEAIGTKLSVISREANNGDWKAAAWALEHMWPDEFGNRNRGAAAPNVPINLEITFPGSQRLPAMMPSSIVEVGHGSDSGPSAA